MASQYDSPEVAPSNPETPKHLPSAVTMCDEAALTKLNAHYIESFLKTEVEWYKQHLADDFVCIEANGSVLDKAQFLRTVAGGPNLSDYQLRRARIRVFGDVALVSGEGWFQRRDATTGTSRYTVVYLRIGVAWKAVSVQVTHTLKPRRESLL
jgi:hypothetical protein